MQAQPMLILRGPGEDCCWLLCPQDKLSPAVHCLKGYTANFKAMSRFRKRGLNVLECYPGKKTFSPLSFPSTPL